MSTNHGPLIPPPSNSDFSSLGAVRAALLAALTSALEMHGMTVLYADNGAHGVRLLSEHPEVDIVLMDAMMPDMDGNETTRAIRRNRRFADLPVVFLTAKAMPGDRESSFAAGASDYITKPVDLDVLLETMAGWVTGRAAS